MQTGKVQYLEGLRGIAAMQVVLLHFVTAFIPTTAEQAWPPLSILFDGHTAVYVFFLISGAVLTPSFARPGPFTTKLGKRIVRLAIPVAVAAAIATVLIAAMPYAHGTAAALTGSKWLAMDSSGAPTFEHLAREIGLDSLLLGYREVTLFMPFARLLTPMQQSLDAPFWSLHLELYGSLLVLCLVTLRAWSPALHHVAIAACAIAFGTHPIFLFVLGHLLPPLAQRQGRGERLGGAILLLLGLSMSAIRNWPILEPARAFLAHTELAAAPTLFQFQSQLAAVALFLGVRHAPYLWPALQSVPLRHLGRLSFSIYLLHFPILFTVVCLAFTALPSITAAFALFLAVTLLAAIAFQRWIDAPAIALSHRFGAQRRNALTSVSA
ncbi:MAG TPA: acyltransferase [Acetobacteraceae bacterium]|jgi:peptidoglycan/LPS O-acetylase OafA/YrhL|nr:acyltransferase [Acetobacteraceae bacterium]